MKNGDRLFAWIDYDGSVLEARINRTGLRPNLPTVKRTVNVTDQIGGPVGQVGFTAATGDGYANHDVLAWQFNSTYDPILALLPTESLTLGADQIPALTLTGSVGSTYKIQYVEQLAKTNNWMTLTNLVLASNPQLWLDQTSPVTQARFYKVIPQ